MKNHSDFKFAKILNLIKKREVSCEELANNVLDNIEKYDDTLESYISTHRRNELINKAKESDKRWKSGEQLSDIDGIPVALKDNIHTTGLNTTCGSKILYNYNPCFDATVSKNIKDNGGIIVGKTNMDEFAMGSTSETSAMKKTKNPYDTQRVPGGSSGGSAVSVAADMAVLSLGSDTGGSIRQPAAFCGVVGIKPTYGLVSRFGLVAYASSLDQIGPISKDVTGCAALLNVISGFDSKDSTSLETTKKDYTKLIGKDIKGLKIAVLKEMFNEGIKKEIKDNFDKSVKALKDMGAIVEEISFEAIKYVISTYYFIATAEAASNLSRYDGVKYGFRSPKQANYEEMLKSTRSYGFGKEVKKRILLGNFVLSSGYYDEYYRKSQKVRSLIMGEMKKIFEKFDVIASPSTPDAAFKFGQSESDPLKIYLSDVTTVLANLSGIPAISVPSGKIDGLPIGIQFMGKPLSEEVLFQVADAFQKNVKENFTPDLSKIGSVEKNISDEKITPIEKTVEISRYSMDDIKKISNSYNDRKKFEDNRVLCDELEKNIGKKVVVKGWIHKINNLGGIEFYTLRDRTGFTQIVFEGDSNKEKINLETVVEAEGVLTKEERSPYDGIELKAQRVKILGSSNSDIPISVNGNYNNITLPTILDNRGLSLRIPKVLNIFKVQSEILRLYSEFLRNNNFSEIKTAKIISTGTEGGANIFEIKYFDRAAYLAQSPQFYKQTMVGSGFERVFEVGPVFRAEMSNTIRHLSEYTSMDFEMGFIKDEQDIIDMQEAMLKYILTDLKKNNGDMIKEEFGVDLIIPENFPRIHFIEALDIAAKAGVKDLDGDISPEGERTVCEYIEKTTGSPFVYIVGYPIKKRPMYAMPDERLPGYTRSFDLLYKGLEITTGGQRINDYETLRRNIIAFGGNPATFKSYLDIFKYGMPPHGGLGMGLERVTMKLLGFNNVRETTLFPRDISRLTP